MNLYFYVLVGGSLGRFNTFYIILSMLNKVFYSIPLRCIFKVQYLTILKEVYKKYVHQYTQIEETKRKISASEAVKQRSRYGPSMCYKLQIWGSRNWIDYVSE